MAEDPIDPTAQHLAAQLTRGVELLRGRRPADAIEPLSEVARGLAAADDLLDVRARALSLLAQAYLEADRAGEAREPIEQALAIAPPSTDRRDLEELAERIRSRVALEEQARVQSERLAALSVDDIEARTRDPHAFVEVLVRKANAEVDVGRRDEAARIAERALVDAMTLGDVRLEILARLSLARAAPGQAPTEIERALRAADAFGDPNLVTTVVKAAEGHGVALPTEKGPWEDT